MKGIVTKILVLVLIASLFGCSGSGNMNKESDPYEGVTVSADINTGKNKAGNTVYDLVCTIANDSDRELMYVKFCIHFLDKDGNELFAFTPAWKGEDHPLKKGETATYEVAFQDEQEAEKISIEVLEIKDTSEVKPLHVPQKGEYLYEALNNEHINNIKNERPTAIHIVIDHMGAQEIADVTDEETLDALISEFVKIKIANETNEFVTDNYNGVGFEFADGSQYYMSLNLNNLETSINGNMHMYELENFGPFWKLCNELADYPED